MHLLRSSALVVRTLRPLGEERREVTRLNNMMRRWTRLTLGMCLSTTGKRRKLASLGNLMYFWNISSPKCGLDLNEKSETAVSRWLCRILESLTESGNDDLTMDVRRFSNVLNMSFSF